MAVAAVQRVNLPVNSLSKNPDVRLSQLRLRRRDKAKGENRAKLKNKPIISRATPATKRVFFRGDNFICRAEANRTKTIPTKEARRALLAPEPNKQAKERPKRLMAGRRQFFLARKPAIIKGKKAAKKKAKALGSL